MKRLFTPFCMLAVMLIVSGSLRADDRIKRLSTGATISGTILQMSKDEIVLDRSGMKNNIPVGDIDILIFDSQPAEFNTAKDLLSGGHNEDARELLEGVKETSLASTALKTELTFLKAYANAQIAIRGGEITLADAIKNLQAFNKANPQNYRYYESMQLLGDLYMLTNQRKEALAQYTVLAKVESSPILRARGAMGKASVLLDSGDNKNLAEAESLYKEVQALANQGELRGQKDIMLLGCQLGLTRCKAFGGKAAEAEKEVKALVQKIPAEDVAMNARAYNTLGAALKAQEGKTMDAIVAYMHTHLLYAADPVLHREAMNELILLFRSNGDDLRASDLEKERKAIYGS